MLTEHDSHVENSGTAAAVEYCPNITVSGALAGHDQTSVLSADTVQTVMMVAMGGIVT